MPSARITGLLAALVILGTGFLFFFEARFETTTEHQRTEDRVLQLTTDEVVRIKIRRDAWTSTVLERVDAHSFRVVEPTEGPADRALVTRLLSDLEFLKRQSVLEGADDKRRYSYGLSPARLELDIELHEGREIHMSFGNTPAVGAGVYLSVLGTDPVYVVDERVFSTAGLLLDRVVGSSATDSGERVEER
jgi:hypothetical protein